MISVQPQLTIGLSPQWQYLSRGKQAATASHRLLFMPLDRLISALIKAKQENRLERQLQQLCYARVLILDEIGYLPMNREEASLFFRLADHDRTQRRSLSKGSVID